MSEQKNKKEMINVSDIVAWLYCPRKLYLSKVLGLKTKPNKKMIIGKLKHNIIEAFSKREEEFVKSLNENYEKLDLVLKYEEFIKQVSQSIFYENKNMIEGFRIDKEEVFKIVMKDFTNDLKLRINAIKEKLNKDVFGEELWRSLDSVYISELKVESQDIGLRGRVDRVEIQKKENKIIPYELKTRDEKIFYSDELQLTAYIMLLEEFYKTKISKGFIESGANKQEIEITPEDRENVLKLAEEIRQIRNNLPPEMLSNFNKCKSCDFQEQCLQV